MKTFVKLTAIALALIMGITFFASCAGTKTTGGKTGETIVVGYTIYSPMNFIDSETNELVGFDTDLAKAVFEDLGYTVVFKEIVWDQKYTELESGTINCIWNGFTSNGEDNGKARSEYVDFSYNYMKNKQVVVAKNDFAETVTSAADLAEKVGSAEKGSIGYDYLGSFEGAITKDASSQLAALQDLKLGGCSFVVLDEQLAKAYVGSGDYADYTIIDALSSDDEFYAIGFKKGSSLTAQVNSKLVEFAASGKLTEIAQKYKVDNAVITNFDSQSAS